MEDNFPLYINRSNGGNHVRHIHDFTELVIVEEGRAFHVTDSFRYLVVKGDVLTVPQGAGHGYEKTENFKISNIIFKLDMLDSLPDDFKNIPGFHSLFMLEPHQQYRNINQKGFLRLNPDEILAVKHLTDRISLELREKTQGYRSASLLALASKHNLGVHHERLAEVLEYMALNYRKTISLEQLSRQLFMSPRSFQRLFHDYMGISPFAYLMNLRLQHARKLLLETKLDIGEIAEACGFGGSAYFTRQFKKNFKMPPTVYRKHVLNQ
jgi:AraC-like DNA-binding protein